MLTVFRESLSKSYLLIVASNAHALDITSLERALHRAGRSGKPAVWLDCSLLAPQDVTEETCLLLRAYDEAFATMGVSLTVAHASPELVQGLQPTGEAAGPQLVDWLDVL